MTRAVFAFDQRFIEHGGEVLSEAQMPAAQWDRYLRVFGRLEVFARRGVLAAGKGPDQLNVSSRPEISFSFVPNLASPLAQCTRRAEAVQILRDAIAGADAVIARLPSENGLIAARTARALGKPYVIEMLGCPWDGLWNYGTWQGKLYAPVMAWRTRQAVKRAPFAIYVTRDFLQRRYPCEAGHTVGCSDVEVPPPDAGVFARRRAKLDAPSGKIVFGLIGSLHGKVKGIHSALEAFSRLKNSLPAFEFRILGAGDAAPWIDLAEQLGVARVTRFDGTLPSGAPVLEWLDSVDVYLQPSFKEGLPRALVEAMNRGCPAIASSAGGMPELLEAECLHRPGDVDALSKLVSVAANDAGWRSRHAERNWRAAGEYAREPLQQRRNAFWDQFIQQARIQ